MSEEELFRTTQEQSAVETLEIDEILVVPDSPESLVDGACPEHGVSCNGDHGEMLDHGHDHGHGEHGPNCQHCINEANHDSDYHRSKIDHGDSRSHRESERNIHHSDSSESKKDHHEHDHNHAEHGPHCPHCINEANQLMREHQLITDIGNTEQDKAHAKNHHLDAVIPETVLRYEASSIDEIPESEINRMFKDIESFLDDNVESEETKVSDSPTLENPGQPIDDKISENPDLESKSVELDDIEDNEVAATDAAILTTPTSEQPEEYHGEKPPESEEGEQFETTSPASESVHEIDSSGPTTETIISGQDIIEMEGLDSQEDLEEEQDPTIELDTGREFIEIDRVFRSISTEELESLFVLDDLDEIEPSNDDEVFKPQTILETDTAYFIEHAIDLQVDAAEIELLEHPELMNAIDSIINHGSNDEVEFKKQVHTFFEKLKSIDSNVRSDKECAELILTELVKLLNASTDQNSSEILKHYTQLFGSQFIVKLLFELREIEKQRNFQNYRGFHTASNTTLDSKFKQAARAILNIIFKSRTQLRAPGT